MPYVSGERRGELDLGSAPASPGDLNYVLTSIVIQYVQDHGLSYAVINDIIGALEGCKLEFYRRVAEPYEVSKILANGDVYPEAISPWRTVRRRG